jgi:ribonuclease-3
MAHLYLENIGILENALGYSFNNKSLLRQALTHKSFANENPDYAESFNERLEYLGDAVLELVISEYLFRNYPHYAESELSKIKSYTVKESTIAKAARLLHLGSYLFLGKGEEVTGGREKPSVLSDAFEALIASIYIDGGLEAARTFILTCLKDDITNLIERNLIFDYKTEVQQIAQSIYGVLPRYQFHKEEGPDHDKTFEVDLYVKDVCLGSGKGKNKKEAAQKAAQAAIEKLKALNNNPSR